MNVHEHGSAIIRSIIEGNNRIGMVDKADIYVGLFAFRYGYVPPEGHGNAKKLSITELEFRHAESLGKPCLLFVADDKASWPLKFRDTLAGNNKVERIDTLRTYLLMEKLASPFSSPHELSTLVLAAVTRHLAESTYSKSSGPKEPEKAGHHPSKQETRKKIWGTPPLQKRSWMGRVVRFSVLGGVSAGCVVLTWLLAERGLTELNVSLAPQEPAAQCQHQSGWGPEMIVIPGGSFKMGDRTGTGTKDEQPVQSVTISSFAIGICEVTFDEYDAFAKATGLKLPDDQGWGRGQRPVIKVSWQNAKDYATWLSEQTGKRYRLPTEAEWEYAAGSGGKQETWAGTSAESELGNYAIYNKNSGNKTAEVGSKQANGFGVHDLSGNVWEWGEDCWHENYDGAPMDGSAWVEAGNGVCGRRVIRGGSWSDGPGTLRSSNRYGGPVVNRYNFIGFRLVQDTP